MTVNREETCSPLQTDPILPVLYSHSAFEYQAMANIALDTFALPVFSTFCAVPTSKPPLPSMEKHPEVRSWVWRAHVALLEPPRITPAYPSSVRDISYSMRPQPIQSSDYAQDNNQLAQYIRNMWCLRCSPV